MEGCSGTIYAMAQRIRVKLLALDATSKEKAVTAQEAKLNEQERNWLGYVAGGMLAKVKKTKDRRYYVLTAF